MNVLDENIDIFQREQLEKRKIPFRRIGGEVGHLGMKDRDQIIPLLHSLRRPTFFTRDHGFYRPELRHARYCLVYLDIRIDETAAFIRRFLSHPAFRTQTQRMGKVFRIRRGGLSYWQAGLERVGSIAW